MTTAWAWVFMENSDPLLARARLFNGHATALCPACVTINTGAHDPRLFEHELSREAGKTL